MYSTSSAEECIRFNVIQIVDNDASAGRDLTDETNEI